MDSEEDQIKADLEKTKTATIMSMYIPDPTTGETVVTRDEMRQMLADNVDYFPSEFLLIDVTDSETATDTDVVEEKALGPQVTIDQDGKIRTKEKRGKKMNLIYEKAVANYRNGLVEAEDLATFALLELADA